MTTAKPKYHVTLFWAHKKSPDEFDTDSLETLTKSYYLRDQQTGNTYQERGPLRPGLYIAEGLVMCIRENVNADA